MQVVYGTNHHNILKMLRRYTAQRMIDLRLATPLPTISSLDVRDYIQERKTARKE